MAQKTHLPLGTQHQKLSGHTLSRAVCSWVEKPSSAALALRHQKLLADAACFQVLATDSSPTTGFPFKITLNTCASPHFTPTLLTEES